MGGRAVWSRDKVRMDEEGFICCIGRRDEMIRSSGYRVSPAEVEEVVCASGLVAEAAARGVPHPVLGQAIVVVASPRPGAALDPDAVIDECRRRLPGYMVPSRVLAHEGSLPRNPNGKIDRKRLGQSFAALFEETV